MVVSIIFVDTEEASVGKVGSVKVVDLEPYFDTLVRGVLYDKSAYQYGLFDVSSLTPTSGSKATHARFATDCFLFARNGTVPVPICEENEQWYSVILPVILPDVLLMVGR